MPRRGLGSSVVSTTGRHLLTVLLAASIAALGAGCGSSGSSKSESTALRFFWTESTDKLAVDLAPKGKVNRGDVISGRSVLRNQVAQLGRRRGAVVGRVVATFHVVSPRKARIALELRFRGGGFDAAGGPSTAPWHGRLRVTHGTGRFHGARGTGELRQFPDRSVSSFRLVLPPSG
ncbi:MAG TPA: hypothetical protein VFK76_01520 [Gaiellaceae bacterium]|nr:hypothetical protein [Gaiellaceae bacterium]